MDQIRNQRNRCANGNSNGLSQTCITKFDILANNGENLKISLKDKRIDKKDDSLDTRLNRNFSVLKSEINEKFAPIFLSPDIGRSFSETAFHNYVPNSFSPALSCLHPALFTAASVGLPSHYLSSSISTYPEVATAILRSQADKSVAEIGLSRDKCLIDESQLSCLTRDKSYDLKKVLQMVDSKVMQRQSGPESFDKINNSSFRGMRSSNPSPLTLSAASLPLPQITPIDSPDDKLTVNCRYCDLSFESKSDLYQHESHGCRQRNCSSNKSSNKIEIYDKSGHNSNAINSSAAESDDESQRDSSSIDEDLLISDGKKVRVRSVLGEETLRVLRSQYDINPRPKKHDILRLAQEVNYSPRVVQVWFQNMRLV